MFKLSVFLHKDRTQAGVALLTVNDGTNVADPLLWHAPCYGKSDNTKAKEAGNESRNPLLPFGDIPSGGYTARIVGSSGPGRVYGPNKRLLLTGVSGDAKIALGPSVVLGQEEWMGQMRDILAGGRYNILAHGGALNAAGWFRPTYGCLRFNDPDMESLIDMLESLKIGELDVEITELAL